MPRVRRKCADAAALFRSGPSALAMFSLVVGLSAIAIPHDAARGTTLRPPNDRASACEGLRPRLADPFTVRLEHGAFPESDGPSVAVHIPVGFDATRRPGLVMYFHGWNGCVTTALAPNDTSCVENGPLRAGSDLAEQVDAAGINALLVAIELRVDAPTGEPGQLAIPGGARDLLRELFMGPLAKPLGCALQVDALDRIVVIAHSGGYQAAASTIAHGDLPEITEVDLLDALYGASDVFARWIADDVERFDSRHHAGLRFVDLYTCCGGTSEPSLSLARTVESALTRAGLAHEIDADDRSDAVSDARLHAHAVVFKRVRQSHGDLPRVYLRALLQAAGFAGLHPS